MVSFFSFDKNAEFVAGLFWQPLAGDASKEVASLLHGGGPETRKLSEELNFDLAVWRSSGPLHVGMGASADSIKVGQYSIAAAVSKTIEVESDGKIQNFLFAAEAPNGRWIYVAQREGVILPDGDACGSDDEIRSRLLNDMSIANWDRIYAPAHWGISSAEERELQDMLPRRKDGQIDYKKWWALRPIKWSHKKPAMALAAMVLVVGGAFVGYQKYDQEMKARAQLEQMRLLAEQQAAGLAPASIEPPWHAQPTARSVTAQCMRGIQEVATLWPGNWRLLNARCDQNALVISWQRQPNGWIEHLLEIYPQVHIGSAGNVATLTVPHQALFEYAQERVSEQRQTTLAFYGASQKYGFNLGLSEIPHPPSPPGQAETTPPPPWTTLQWDVPNTSMPPDVVMAALEGDGFRLEELVMHFQDGLINWTLRGKQYVTP